MVTGIHITKDTLTPAVRRIRKRIPKAVHKHILRLMQYGKKKAQYYATNIKGSSTGDLRKGIFFRVYGKTGRAELSSVATGYNGFPYNLWVNRDITINGKYPYFKSGQGKIRYGDSGVLAPNNQQVNWGVMRAGKMGFFNQAFIDMRRRFPKTGANILRDIRR